MESIASEIDALFITEEGSTEIDETKLIKNYITDSKNAINELDINQIQINKYITIYEFYKLKLKTLSKELNDIEEKNINLDLNIINMKKVHTEIKHILKVTEIEDDHFQALMNPDFDDLVALRMSLYVLKDVECDYKLKAVSDLEHKIKQTLKDFMRKFNLHLQKELNLLESESRGELTIHGHVYKVIKQYEFLIEYCKECDKENFVLISQKYIKTARKMYEKEFEGHFEIVLQSLRESKKKFQEKVEKIFGFVFESLLLIFTSEEDFLRNYFHEDNKFLNDATLTIFNDVIELVFDFIKDAHRINNPLTISAIHKNKGVDVEYNIKHLDVYKRFKKSVDEILNKYEKQYVDKILISWGYESKLKLVSAIVADLMHNDNKRMVVYIIGTILDKILDHKKDGKRGKVEFEIYRSKLLFILESVNSEENRSNLEKGILIIREIFEKEVITYIFSVEQKKMLKRISNILKVIRDYFHDDQNNCLRMIEVVKENVFDHVTQDFKEKIKDVFSSKN